MTRALLENTPLSIMEKNNAVKVAVGFFATCFFVVYFSHQAYGANGLVVKDLSFESPNYKNNDVVKGQFIVENASGKSSDYIYEITLHREGKVFSREVFGVSEQIEPEENVEQKFEHRLPVNMRSGKYILKIQLYSRNEAALNWEEKEVNIEGNDFFINITNSYILKEGKRLDAKEIPEYYAGDSPQIEVDVYNPNDTDLVLVPRISLRSMDYPEAEQERFFANEIILIPKKNEKNKIDMPKLYRQGAYIAELEFLYNGENISSIEYFSWKIIKRNAKILNIKTENGLYYPKKKNNLLVEIGEYLDEGETRKAELIVEIRDRYFVTLETLDKEIELRSGNAQEEFASSVATEDNFLNINAVIKADGKTIDVYDGKLAVKIDREINGKKDGGIISIIAAFFILFILVFFFARKKFKG